MMMMIMMMIIMMMIMMMIIMMMIMIDSKSQEINGPFQNYCTFKSMTKYEIKKTHGTCDMKLQPFLVLPLLHTAVP